MRLYFEFDNIYKTSLHAHIYVYSAPSFPSTTRALKQLRWEMRDSVFELCRDSHSRAETTPLGDARRQGILFLSYAEIPTRPWEHSFSDPKSLLLFNRPITSPQMVDANRHQLRLTFRNVAASRRLIENA